MIGNPVVWFEIYADDMERAQAFYETVLGIRMQPMEPPGLEPEDAQVEMRGFPGNSAEPGAVGALARMPGFAPGGSGTLVYFACEDCAVEASRIAGAGGRLVREKSPIGEYGFIALGVDTEGNTFGLHSMA